MVTKMDTIILTEPEDFPKNGLTLLEQMGIVILGPLSRAELLQHAKQATILFIRLGHYIDKEFILSAPHLKVIVTSTTGLNHIDVEFCQSRNITVLSLRGETEFLETISPTADLTFGLILSLIRQIPQSITHVCEGGWDRNLFKGRDLRERVLGIYGYGRIGRKVARMGLAFDMRVIAYDVAGKNYDEGVEKVSEQYLLSHSDIISIHVLHDDQNDGLFSAEKFESMKNGAYFINTARGELIDELALLSTLKNGHLAGAALDVINNEHLLSSKENIHNNPLINYASQNSNLLITPHIGGASIDSMARVENFMVLKLQQWMNMQ